MTPAADLWHRFAMAIRRGVTLIVCSLLAACGASDPPEEDDPGDELPAGYQSLLEGDWNLAAGEEGYFCVYQTVPRDLYIKGFRPIGPPGTHHTVLTVLRGNGPADGTEPCDFGTNGQNMIYGSGVGAPDFDFPDGVGLHLPAGTRLLLNLHLFNGTDAPLTGRSGTLFREAAPEEVEHVAELVLAGPLALEIDDDSPMQTGACHLANVIDEPVQVFALSQHMHKLGRRMVSTIERPGADDIVLQDTAYDFEEQAFHHVSEVELRPEDTLVTDCYYEPIPGETVTFGESSNDEMCFTDLFYYPAQGANFICPF